MAAWLTDDGTDNTAKGLVLSVRLEPLGVTGRR